MAWTAPRTWVTNEVVTAALFNTHIRDNFLETAPAKAGTAGGIFVATGANAIAERVPDGYHDAGQSTTTATSFGDLAAGADTGVTVTTGTQAIVWMQAQFANSTAGAWTAMAIDVSGATTQAASINYSISYESGAANDFAKFGGFIFYGVTGGAGALTAGSNTFTGKYRVSAGTGTVSARAVAVLPL